MKRLLVAAVVAAGALLGPASPACACSCVPLTEAEAFERADAVFAATLVRRDEPGGPVRSSNDPVMLTWTVDAVYKGDAGKVQQVMTAESSASCGLEAEVGKRYLVHADAVGRTLEASLCGGTRPLAGAAGEAGDQLTVSGRAGEPPAAGPELQHESTSTVWWPFALGGGLLGAGLLVALWIVRRRPRGADGTPAAGAV